MKNILRYHKNLQQGYTIVEIIVVVMVIGILASIVIIGGSGYLDSTAKTNAKTNLIDVQRAMKKAYDENGKYPSGVPVNALSGVELSAADNDGGNGFCVDARARGVSFRITEGSAEPESGDCGSYTPPSGSSNLALDITPSTTANLEIDDDANFYVFNLVPSGGSPPYSYLFSSADSGTEVISYDENWDPEQEKPWTAGDIFQIRRSGIEEENDAILLSPGFESEALGINVSNNQFLVRSSSAGSGSADPDYVCTTWGPANFTAKINVTVTDSNDNSESVPFNVGC